VRPRPLVLTGSLVVTAGCIGDPAPEVAGRAAALTSVTWTDLVGVSASVNDLTKTAPETTYNAGAVSVESLSNDGFVEFTTAEATTDKIAGLSVGNGGQGRADIDFGILLNASGRASVWEGGVNRGGIGVYAAGDTFRVRASGGVVTYWRNDILKYTSALAPSFPLLVDTSLRTPGATIQDVSITSLVFWRNVVNASAVDNDLTNTSGPGWTAGASSVESLAGDGYVEFTTGEDTEAKMAGLGSGDTGTGYADIEFAIHLNAASGVSVYESGVNKGSFGAYLPGDVFRVQVEDGVVTYLQNGVEFYQSLVAPSFPLVLDASLRSVGATILDAKLVGGPIIECAPFQQTLPHVDGNYIKLDASGDLLLVSNPYTGGNGEVLVYRRTGATWALEQTLSRAGDADDNFGLAMATDGQTIAVAGRNPGTSGSIQVYRYDGASWVDDGLLTECGGPGFWALAVQGDFIVAGVTNNPYFTSGRVNVYRRGTTSWRLNAVIVPPDNADGDMFGDQVAIGGSRLFAAAPFKDTLGSNAGGVYVYRFDPSLPSPGPNVCSPTNPGKWVQETVLNPPGAGPDSYFGSDGFDASGDGMRLIAGDYRHEVARVFALSGGAWAHTAALTGAPSRNRFGYDVEFAGPTGNVAVVGSWPIINPGIAYVFADDGAAWHQIAFLEPPAGASDYFARYVAANDDTVFVGDENTASYVYGLDPICPPE